MRMHVYKMTTLRLSPEQKETVRKAAEILEKSLGRRLSQGEAVAALAEFALQNRADLANAFASETMDLASAAGRAILESKNLRLVRIEPPVFAAAWKLFVRRSDKRWSFTDCTSFVLMENMDLRKALAFDRNFVEAGFAMIP